MGELPFAPLDVLFFYNSNVDSADGGIIPVAAKNDADCGRPHAGQNDEAYADFHDCIIY